MCRERAAKRPQDLCLDAKMLGLPCSPFATQGRSHKSAQACQTWANRALRARHPATSDGPSATSAEPSTTVTAPT